MILCDVICFMLLGWLIDFNILYVRKKEREEKKKGLRESKIVSGVDL